MAERGNGGSLAPMLPRITALFAIACAAVPAWAATYQVGPTRTYKDLNAVSARIHGGDVVEVDGGVTYVGQVTFRNSGTEATPITIRGLGAGAARPHLSTSGGIAGGAVVRFWGHHYAFENFEVSANRDATTARGLHVVAHNITVRDCIVHDVAGQGIHGSDSAGSVILDRVEVYRCGLGSYSHQIYVATDNEYVPGAVFRMQGCYIHDGLGGNNVKSRAGRSEIYYNWIEGAAYHELDLIGADPAGQLAGTAGWVREDADVVGNVLRKRAGSAGYFARLGTDTTGSSNARYRFFHNTCVVDPAFTGTVSVFGVNAAVQSLEVFNNVFFSPSAALRVVYGTTFPAARSTGGNNWVSTAATGLPGTWTGTLSGSDPGFTDAAELDFTPRADGPLFGAGAAASTSPAGYDFPNPLTAPAQHPRTPSAPAAPRPSDATPDIGAFERADPAPNQPNTPPQAANDVLEFITSLAITIPVLANDSDAEGDTLVLTSITRPLYGTASIVGGAIVYAPRTGFPGEEILTYRVSDGRAVATATLTLRNAYALARGIYAGSLLAGDVADGFTGALRLAVDGFGAFTGTLQLGPKVFALRGLLDHSGDAHLSIPRLGLPTLSVALHMDFDPATLTAAVSDGTRTATVTSDRILYDKTQPLEHAGIFTTLLPLPTQRTFPPGNGYASVSVSATGSTRITGTLGDGMPFSVGGWMHRDGTLPVFVSLYAVRGSLSGAFAFSGEGASGVFTWWKPAQLAGLYRTGFRLDLEGVAARWSRAAWHGGSVGLTLAGGDLTTPAAASARLAPPALPLITDAGGMLLSFDVTAASGLFKARIQHPVLLRVVDVRGAVLQAQALGAGVFVGSTAVGSADLALAP